MFLYIVFKYEIHRKLEIPDEVTALATEKDFEVKLFGIGASPEQTRPPRKVRVAVVQNSIVRPTTDPIKDQVSPGKFPLNSLEDLRRIIRNSFYYL